MGAGTPPPANVRMVVRARTTCAATKSRLLVEIMSHDDPRPPRLSPTPELLGGSLCLDFANTVDAGRTASPRDRLHDYADLVTWARHAGMVAADQEAALRASARADPAPAGVAFKRAIELREAIYRIFSALADGGDPSRADLAALQRRYVDALAAARLRRRGAAFAWSWDDAPAEITAVAPDRILWPIVQSAVDLLTSPELGRVKACASGTCRWLFVDASKNAARRWCSMADCGSRAKMRRQYARRKAARAVIRQ